MLARQSSRRDWPRCPVIARRAYQGRRATSTPSGSARRLVGDASSRLLERYRRVVPSVLCYGDSNTWRYDPVSGERLLADQRWPGDLFLPARVDAHGVARGIEALAEVVRASR